ncbi:response regulator [soil metagenome]
MQGCRVLIVEDEMIVAWLLTDMLEEIGCTVVGPASTVAQAIKLIELEALDAATVDVNLNGELSYPVADALRARSIPFLFSTGYDRSRLHEGYQALPMLQKPYHHLELEKALIEMLKPGVGGHDAAPPLAA